MPLYGHFKVEKCISSLSTSFPGKLSVEAIDAIDANARCEVMAQHMEKGCLFRKAEKTVTQNQGLPSTSQEMEINKGLGLWVV